jgi:hypothetical protein
MEYVYKKYILLINMNLNFTEIDNLGEQEQQFDVNYWETTQVKPQETKKKKFSYDDILNSLNVVVNKNGVLQYITTTDAIHEQQLQSSPQQIKGKPLEPQVKNSQIYNKYFKDYKDPNAEYVQEVKVPQTIEEYNRMVLEERIKRILEIRRISQIKSTKLLFESNNNGNSSSNIINNQPISASKNSLRMMKFN